MTTTYIKNVLGTDFITGFKIKWVSATSLKISSGAAALPSGQFIVSGSDITLSSMSLSASTWYHLYLVSATSIEYSTTAPAAAYFGTARTKTGNTTRRYLGSFRTNASAQILYFTHAGEWIIYGEDWFTTLRVLNGGTATTETDVSLSALVPTTSNLVQISVSCLTQRVNIASSGADNVSGTSRAVQSPPAERYANITINTDEFQNISYWVFSGGVAYIQLQGYALER